MAQSHFQQVKKGRDMARSGILNTRRGAVKTPLFMPVATRGLVKGVPTEMVAQTGVEVMLSNTYHLHLQPGEAVIQKLGGLHEFSGWPGPILTDSGGFQVFSLAHTRKITEEGVEFKDPITGQMVMLTPEKSMQIQLELGSDIIMAFDDLTGLSGEDSARTKEAMERTHRWLQRCITEFQKLTKGLQSNQRPLLFGIIQGGLDKKLRRQALDFVQSQPVDGIAIGGLSVGESRPEMYDILDFLSTLYDPGKVHYLMGVGSPADLRVAFEKNIDMVDCVMPTRNGRHGSVWGKNDKKLNLLNQAFTADKKPIQQGCDCYSCLAGYSGAVLRHLFKVGDPLAGMLCSVHNIRHLQRICEFYQK